MWTRERQDRAGQSVERPAGGRLAAKRAFEAERLAAWFDG